MTPLLANLQFIQSGAMGCTFAALFARDPSAIQWNFITDPEKLTIPPRTLLLSLIFPKGNKAAVKAWALAQGFYLEDTGPSCQGLRYKFPYGVSWVQYFGPDSHVATRRTPYPMLTMAVKLNAFYYPKVGFKGILHLAHASIYHLRPSTADKLWDTSFSNTTRQLGHKPGIQEAAKTTFYGE